MLPSIVSYETEREPCVPAEYGHVCDVTWAGWGPDRGRYTYMGGGTTNVTAWPPSHTGMTVMACVCDIMASHHLCGVMGRRIT